MTLHSIGMNPTPSGQGQQAFSQGVEAGQTSSSAQASTAMQSTKETASTQGKRPPPPPPPEDAEGSSTQSTEQISTANSANLFQSLLQSGEGVAGGGSFNLSADSAMAEMLYNNAQSALGAGASSYA